MTSTGGIDLNFGHPTMTYDFAGGSEFDYYHDTTVVQGNPHALWGQAYADGFVGSNYPIEEYTPAPRAWAMPPVNLEHAGAPAVILPQAANFVPDDRSRTRMKYAAIAGAAFVATGAALFHRTGRKPDKAETIASPEPTAKAVAFAKGD